MPARSPEPPCDCRLCPRLVTFRDEARQRIPDGFNAPVPSFGDAKSARLLIVGLAPGLQGANRTGRPFTGDYAGDLLYATLLKFGLASGSYLARSDDGLRLERTMITNAVRCVPPQNKPTPEEIRTCRSFFIDRIETLPSLKVVLALGRIAHDQTLAALGLRKASYPFAHAARHDIAIGTSPPRPIAFFDSFHCSRYNTNTGRLTTQMFEEVFARIRQHLDQSAT
jgi:uracil-DNA glycosylase